MKKHSGRWQWKRFLSTVSDFPRKRRGESRVLEARPQKERNPFPGRKPTKERKIWDRQLGRRHGVRRTEGEEAQLRQEFGRQIGKELSGWNQKLKQRVQRYRAEIKERLHTTSFPYLSWWETAVVLDNKWRSDWYVGGRAAIQRDLPHQNKIMQHSSLGKRWLESSFAEEDLRVWVDKFSMNQHHALEAMKSSCIQICICKSLVRKSRDGVTPLYLAHLTPHLDTVSSCGSPSGRERLTNWSESSRGHQDGQGAGAQIWERDGGN